MSIIPEAFFILQRRREARKQRSTQTDSPP
jgi:hypothetical protein